MPLHTRCYKNVLFVGNYHNDYRVAQLLGKESSPDQYYYQSGPSSHMKRVVRKVVFGSNSHLNNISEGRGRKELHTPPEAVAGPSALGSETLLNNLTEEKAPKKNSTLSHSISNLFFNSKLNIPTVDRTWSSELDKTENVKYKRPTIKPGNMVFSSSTSDLLGLKRNKILPSLSRHRNCERLDVSDECLDKIDILKHENMHFQPDNESFEDVSFGINGGKLVNVDGDGGTSTSSSISWTDPGFTEKVFGSSGNSATSDNLLRASGEIGHFGLDKLNKSHSIHNIRLMQNEDVSEENNASTSSGYQFGGSSSSRRNLEVGSERRCRRVKKIPKLDHNNLQEHKNRLDGVSRRHFLLGYGNQGYEAAIQKMPNNCCLRLGDKSDVRGYPSEEKFTPLYERIDRRVQEVNQGTKPKLRGNVTDDEKLIMGLKINNSPMAVLCDSKESENVVLPSIGAGEGDVRGREAGGSVNGAESKKTKRIRCAFCKKRLSIASIHTCRCGVVFCAPHRYAEVHGCRYDYKAEGQEYLRRANPLVSAPKLPKI